MRETLSCVICMFYYITKYNQINPFVARRLEFSHPSISCSGFALPAAGSKVEDDEYGMNCSETMTLGKEGEGCDWAFSVRNLHTIVTDMNVVVICGF